MSMRVEKADAAMNFGTQNSLPAVKNGTWVRGKAPPRCNMITQFRLLAASNTEQFDTSNYIAATQKKFRITLTQDAIEK